MKGAMTRLRLLVVPVVAALALAGCGSSSKTKTTSSGTPSTVASLSTSTSAAASGGSSTVQTASTKLGTVLVDAQGRTLYHLAPETTSHIVCTGGCTSTWPPLLVEGTAKPSAGAGVTAKLTVVMRPDGKDQVAADGLLLYTYSGDHAAGDTNGEGVAGVWHVVKVGAAAGTATTVAGNATTTTYTY